MRKILVFLFLMGGLKTSYSQISVYDCNASYLPITNNDIFEGGYEFYRSCIKLGSPNNISITDAYKKIEAATEIHLKSDVHLGADQFGEVWLKIKEKSSFEVVSVNYSNLDEILRYKKFELGIELPDEILQKVNNFVLKQIVNESEKLNPFLENNLKITASFTHLETGKEVNIDGFYYRDYLVDYQANEWIETPTNYPFRVRFAPPKNGIWKVKIEIKNNKDLVNYQAPDFLIKVIESGHPGFVKVAPNEKNLMLGNDIIFPVGQNFAWPEKLGGSYLNPWKINPETGKRDERMDPKNWDTFINRVADFNEQGGKYIRFILHPQSMDVEWEELGNYYDRMDFAWHNDRFFEMLEQREMLTQFNLLCHNILQEQADYSQFNWDFSDYQGEEGVFDQPSVVRHCYIEEFGLQKPSDLFTNQQALEYSKQRHRYLISRYGYSTSISMFELVSEVYHVNEKRKYLTRPDGSGADYVEPGDVSENYENNPNTRAAVYNYNSVISSYLKNDLNVNQLIGVDYSFATNIEEPAYAPYYPFNPDEQKGYPDFTFLLETVDIIGLNSYGSTPDKFFLEEANNENTNENSLSKAIKDMHTNFRKPVYFSEYGHGDAAVVCMGEIHPYVIDIMMAPFTGCAGMNMWHGSERDEIDYTHRTNLVTALYHMNEVLDVNYLLNNYSNISLLNEGLKKNKIKETHYYLSDDKSYGAGVVRNRTFNTHSYPNAINFCMFSNDNLYEQYYTGIDLPYDEKKIDLIDLLPNTEYKFKWYSYMNGTIAVIQTGHSTNFNGKMLLRHPELIVNDFDNLSPVLWYTFENDEAKSLLASENDATRPAIRFEEKLTLVENPIEDKLILAPDMDVKQIHLYDMYGKLIKITGTENNSIDVSFLSAGIYYLSVNNEQVIKIIKL